MPGSPPSRSACRASCWNVRPGGATRSTAGSRSRTRQPLPLVDYEIVLGRGPFALEGERELLRRHRIDVLVAKASGGLATEAKLVAAREAGLPVVMLRRPKPEPGPRVCTVEAALAWLDERLAGAPLAPAEAARR